MNGIVPELEGRRAFRAFSSQSIPSETVTRLFEAAALAPSAANKQPWRFAALQGKAALAEAHTTLTDGNYWVKAAPLVVAPWTHASYDLSTPDGRQFALFDLGQSVMALQLQAQRDGLIAHPLAGFDAGKMTKLLGLPEGAQLPVLIAVGYPGSDAGLSDKHKDAEKSPRTRLPLADFVSFR